MVVVDLIRNSSGSIYAKLAYEPQKNYLLMKWIGPCTEEESEAVMFFAYTGVQRSLEADDIAALQELYPQAPTTTLPAVTDTTGDGVIDATSSSLFVPLTSGWNLTYLPAGDLQRFVTELECVEGVYGWDGTNGWERWLRGLTPSMQTLRSTTAGNSYWVLASGDCAAFFYD